MPAAGKAPVLLVCGEDDYAVKERAREVFRQWSAEIGGMDHEIIDASVNNSGEALAALSRLRAALQTLPFFGDGKVVWLRNCNFLGEERAAAAAAVTENLGDLADELKSFAWKNVRLLVSAAKVDKRTGFYKTLEKIGAVEFFAGWSVEGRNWTDQAEAFAERAFGDLDREISAQALAQLVASTGPNPRVLRNEVEKLYLYAGQRQRIELEDVDAVVTPNKQARAFALGDALGERNLARALRCLDEELWEMRRDPQRNEIGLLYGLISKVRVLLLVNELLARKWLKPETDFGRFKSQLARIPAESLPEDKKFNPLAMNAYALFRALAHARNYTQAELIAAMELMLESNRQLVTRSLDPALVLQRMLFSVIGPSGGKRLAAAA
jgi:DNA polymerase-3 subunit delta